MAYVKGTNPAGQVLGSAAGTTDDADYIEGNAGIDSIFAHGGNDIIKGGGGADWIDGGEGRDTVVYSDSLEGVTVTLGLITGKGKGGTAEGDTLVSIEDVVGSNFNDVLIGNAADNELQGGNGHDTLKGGGGYDRLSGGDGNDIIEADGLDIINGGEGNDTLVINSTEGMSVNLKTGHFDATGGWHGAHPGGHLQIANVENVIGTAYDDRITGNNAANVINGQGGEDQLLGLDGDDSLFGGAGSDLLNGGFGADRLTSGTGHDTFVFSSLIDSPWIAGKPADVIEDFFKGVDKIDLSDLGLTFADLTILNNQTIEGEAGSCFGYDANHNGTFDIGEFAVAVKIDGGAPTLTHTDFLF